MLELTADTTDADPNDIAVDADICTLSLEYSSS